jgi:hypothetical protein
MAEILFQEIAACLTLPTRSVLQAASEPAVVSISRIAVTVTNLKSKICVDLVNRIGDIEGLEYGSRHTH